MPESCNSQGKEIAVSRKTRSSDSMGMILIGTCLSVCLLAACGPQQAQGLSVPPIIKSRSVAAMNQPTSIWTPVVPILPTVMVESPMTPTTSVMIESPTTPATSAVSRSQCGTVTLAPNSIFLQLATAKQAEDCFLRAYQQCKLASLVLSLAGLDIVSIHTFGIEQQQGGCAISDVVQTSLGSQSLGRNFYTCARLEMTETSLRAINCGSEGTINIPSS